jgi:hypothetical protein
MRIESFNLWAIFPDVSAIFGPSAETKSTIFGPILNSGQVSKCALTARGPVVWNRGTSHHSHNI